VALITGTKLSGQAQPLKRVGDHCTDGASDGYATFFLASTYGEYLSGVPGRRSLPVGAFQPEAGNGTWLMQVILAFGDPQMW